MEEPIYEIESEQFKVSCSKTMKKVLSIFPAPDSTFVLLAIYHVGKPVLINMDLHGKIIYEHVFTVPVEHITMISRQQVIALETRNNQIRVFDLLKKSHRDIPFNFMNEESDQAEIVTFCQSQLFCIVEKGSYNDNRFKITYFSTKETVWSPLPQFYQADSQWTYEYLTKKGNQVSMIIWFKPRNDAEFSIKSYEIRDGISRYRQCVVKNEIGLPYNHPGEIQTAINNVWEVEPGKLCLVCSSEKSHLGLKDKNGFINNNFIWTIKDNELRECNFHFEEKYNNSFINIDFFNHFAVFRTFSFNQGKVEKSPCFYIDIKTQRIAAIREWQCSYRYKFQYPCYDPIIVQNQYENGDVDKFVMTILRIVEKK